MTRRQNNNQWSGRIASHPAPKNSELKNPLEKFSPRFFWIQDNFFLFDYLRKGQIMNADYCPSLLMQLKEIRRGRSPKGSCSCTTMPRLTDHLQPRRNWPTWASIILITHPILRIWPRRTTTCSLDKKKQLKILHFSSDTEVIAAAETWLEGQYSVLF